MHHLIVGNGVAGIEAAMTIRRRLAPENASITVISDESDYFFSRTALMYAYMDMMTLRDLEPYERKAYDQQDIELCRARVVDIDADAHTVTLDDGTSLSYDRLLLACGARPRMLPFDGADAVEEGIVHFVSLQDLEACERLTWEAERGVVVGGGLIGIELAECMNFHGLDVTFLIREPYYWPMALGPEEGAIVEEHLREHGIDVRTEEQLDEILSDDHGRVTGVRSDLGNTFDCSMLGICIGVVSNKEWLEACATTPELDRGIVVDSSFRTSLPDVWAAGDCCEIELDDGGRIVETIWYSARRHGKLAALSMLGDEIDYEPPLFYNSTKFFEIEFTTVGDVVDVPEGTRSIYRRMPGEPISQRIVVDDDDQVIGFNMLGSRFDHTILERWIHERRSIDYVLSNLREAQFDVEFGRVHLDRMTEEEKTL
jgi:NADPH-dependent 2,4-dienoyl-CoA reductase/sulfur reductase-like enzyme